MKVFSLVYYWINQKYALKIIIALCLFTSFSKAQNKNVIDSLENQLSNIKNIEEKVDVLEDLAVAYWGISSDSMISIGKRINRISQQNNYTRGLSIGDLRIASGFLNKSNYDKSLEYSTKALENAEKSSSKREIGVAHVTRGIIFSRKSNYYDSFKSYNSGLKVFREIEDHYYTMACLVNIASIYEEINDYDNALKYYLEAKTIGENKSSRKMQTALSSTLMPISKLYAEIGNYKQAEENLSNAVNIFEKLDDKISIASCMYIKAYINLKHGKYNLAINENIKALNYIKNNDLDKIDYILSDIHRTLAKAYFKNKEYDLAETYAKKAYEILKEGGFRNKLVEVSFLLYQIYSQKENYELVDYYIKENIKFKKELELEENNKSFFKEQLAFQIKELEYKKDLELAELKNLNQEREYELQLAQERSNLIWLGLLVLAIVFYAIMITIQKRKIKKVMNENLQLEARVEEIEASIANDLHDNFGNRLAGVLTSYDIVKELNKNIEVKGIDTNFEKFLNNIESNLMSLNGDIKDLLWAMNPDNNELKIIIKRLKKIFESFESRSDIKIRLTHSKTKDKLMMPKLANRQLVLILKEMVNNAIKYSESDFIDISIFIDKNNHLIINCVDYGIGFDINKLNRINGLNNIKERAKLIKFIVELNSEIGKGTEIELKSIYPLKRSMLKDAS